MIWPTNFSDRLSAWNSLRQTAELLPIEQALGLINQWWFTSPWRAYHLHWDDQSEWPNPWELLSDNLYCDVARGLGIVYTITLLNRKDLDDAVLVLTDEAYNLVQVCKSKYILNWEPETIVNNNLDYRPNRKLTQGQLRSKYNL